VECLFSITRPAGGLGVGWKGDVKAEDECGGPGGGAGNGFGGVGARGGRERGAVSCDSLPRANDLDGQVARDGEGRGEAVRLVDEVLAAAAAAGSTSAAATVVGFSRGGSSLIAPGRASAIDHPGSAVRTPQDLALLIVSSTAAAAAAAAAAASAPRPWPRRRPGAHSRSDIRHGQHASW